MSISEKLKWNTPLGSVTIEIGDCKNDLEEII